MEHEEWSGQAVLVWRTRRRNGRPGVTRRRLLKKIKVKGRKQTKVRWQYGGDKTDEPFYYVGTLEDLKREIARAGGKVYIVEGEFDVWSLRRLGIRNVIGIYGIHNIPKDIGAILHDIRHNVPVRWIPDVIRNRRQLAPALFASRLRCRKLLYRRSDGNSASSQPR